MSADQDERAEIIFYDALQQPAAEREAYVHEVCGEDVALRKEVNALLQDHGAATGFLSAPAAAVITPEFDRPMREDVGDVIGNYKLLEQIGEGGFGVVWVAEQERPVRRRVALKIIKLGMDTRDVVARFEQERQALAMMEHSNIAKVLDAGATSTGRPYFVMELVRGIKITQYCDEAKLSTAARLRLFIQVCHAVQHAHQKGVIHRDLKPSNILVTLHDGVPVPKVIDFGVAKATQQQRLTDMTVYTRFEQMIGTPLYMSPEQAEMSGLDIDTRSDIYSLGVLLYELLAGRTPFDPEHLMKAGFDEMRRVIREQEPQRPSTFVSTLALDRRTALAQSRQSDGAKLVGQIRGDLDWIVMKALEKDRNRRYETANGLASDIQRHLAFEPVQARPPSQLYRFRRFAARNKGGFAAAVSVVAALLLGTGVSTWQAVRAHLEANRANAALEKLRASAPAFAAHARVLVGQEKFDEAIKKLEIAASLRPDAAEYLLGKADILQCQLRFAEAAPVYRRAQELMPRNGRAAFHAQLCDALAAQQAAGGKLSRESLADLFQRMRSEGRSATEMIRVSKLLGEENKLLLSYWRERLEGLPIAPERPMMERLTLSAEGRLTLDLSGTEISDLQPIRGMPLHRLILSGCDKVSDLSPLLGMPLRELFLGRIEVDAQSSSALRRRPCGVKDLSPLKGMQLVILDLEGTLITDLTPISGMPLDELILRETAVTDLEPLRGMPLRALDCTSIPAPDFSVLRGMPLESLCLQKTTVEDLSFLNKMPVEELWLNGCQKARGFAVLATLEKLTALLLPDPFAHPEEELSAIAGLRNHPTLRQISAQGWGRMDSSIFSSKEEFWNDFDREREILKKLLKITGGDRGRFTKRANTWDVDLANLPINDISSLRGIPISRLVLASTKLSDLSPLRGLPISRLVLADTKVSDLSPLEGMPLTALNLNATPVNDLKPLRGLPLKDLCLFDCGPGLDLSPLAEIKTLSSILLPRNPKNLDALRALPNLDQISYEVDRYSGELLQSAAEFWSGTIPLTVERLVRQGDLADAEKRLREQVRTSTYVDPWVGLAGVIFASGDRARYQSFCKEMIDRLNQDSGNSKEGAVTSGDTAVKVCLLGPEPPIPIPELEKILHRNEFRDADPRRPAWSALAEGLFYYRAGNAEKAEAILTPVADERRFVAAAAAATAILSMAHCKQGDIRSAQTRLADVRAEITPLWPDGPLRQDWHDIFVAYLLMKEADELLKGAPSAPRAKTPGGPRSK